MHSFLVDICPAENQRPAQYLLLAEFFNTYRQAQATTLDDIPQERIGLKARIDEANGAFIYEDPWVRMTLRPNVSRYELQTIGFHKQVSRISTSICPEIATPGQAIEALKLEVRDYWTSPLHMLPNAPPQVLELFAPFERMYRSL